MKLKGPLSRNGPEGCNQRLYQIRRMSTYCFLIGKTVFASHIIGILANRFSIIGTILLHMLWLPLHHHSNRCCHGNTRGLASVKEDDRQVFIYGKIKIPVVKFHQSIPHSSPRTLMCQLSWLGSVWVIFCLCPQPTFTTRHPTVSSDLISTFSLCSRSISDDLTWGQYWRPSVMFSAHINYQGHNMPFTWPGSAWVTLKYMVSDHIHYRIQTCHLN